MRMVTTRRPSFPEVADDRPLDPAVRQVWQVICGDAGHWRAGLYSPEMTDASEVVELERHDCPELFLLLRGRLTLVLATDEGIREVPLQPGKPIRVTAPHGGYCPDGPFTGVAFVVERDEFDTEYRDKAEWGWDE